MPNKIPIEEIKTKLPPFVKIIEESYKGARYPALFLDTDYNEEFKAIPSAVIKLQHGCRSRSNKLRSDNSKGKPRGPGKRIDINIVKKRLPDYLEIDESSYTGASRRARFYDKEYKVWFERNVSNVIREGKGYCSERELAEFKKSVTLTVDEVKSRVYDIHGDRIILEGSDYINMVTICTWIIGGRKVKDMPSRILNGRAFDREKQEKWLSRVKVRDDFICQKCSSEYKICGHHILPWVRHMEERFNVDNGITLCTSCHNEYHALFRCEETLDNFCKWLDNDEKERLVRERLAAPPHLVSLNLD